MTLVGEAGRWRERLAVVAAVLLVLAAVTYVTRRSLLQSVARIALSRDSDMVAQERADGVAIVFAKPPSAWITPMKNRMNEIWSPINAEGINYFMFAGPSSWIASYSERSNARSPYYQAWVGAYVIKLKDGSLPADVEALAWKVTTHGTMHSHSDLSAHPTGPLPALIGMPPASRRYLGRLLHVLDRSRAKNCGGRLRSRCQRQSARGRCRDSESAQFSPA